MAAKNENQNLALYNQLRKAPKEALRQITAGKLKGKSDINPQWRIETLTATFGPCGVGWYTEIMEHWTERDGNESAAWVRINLYVKKDGEWSKPIEGVGGSKQMGKGQGDGINDEAYKMAETDAISVACKKLGIAADVYWDLSPSKYEEYTQYAQTPQTAPPQPQPPTRQPYQSPFPPAQPMMQQPMMQQPKAANAMTKDEAVAYVNAAMSSADLSNRWNYLAPVWRTNTDVVKAVMDNKYNPNAGRSNGA